MIHSYKNSYIAQLVSKVLEFSERHTRTAMAHVCPEPGEGDGLSSRRFAGGSPLVREDTACVDSYRVWLTGAQEERATGLSWSSPTGAFLIEIPPAGGLQALGFFPDLLVD